MTLHARAAVPMHRGHLASEGVKEATEINFCQDCLSRRHILCLDSFLFCFLHQNYKQGNQNGCEMKTEQVQRVLGVNLFFEVFRSALWDLVAKHNNWIGYTCRQSITWGHAYKMKTCRKGVGVTSHTAGIYRFLWLVQPSALWWWLLVKLEAPIVRKSSFSAHRGV